jgi:homodimeric pyruvate:ferredoxin (flavodoxin) oxidoreductase
MSSSQTAVVAGVAGVAAGAAVVLSLKQLSEQKKTFVAPPVQKPEPKTADALVAVRKECGEGKFGPDDGATAAAWVGYQCSDCACIFPITPSTLMAEMADTWMAGKITNAFDQVTKIQQMQSEAGAAGAVHGVLATGGLCTTFTASQGLLLMLPNMLKIAGELTPCVFHIPARAIASQALSIFGDQNDVMQVRSTGFAILFANSVQETLDFALASHIATLRARVPILHAFDGFRTSHEIMKVQAIPKPVFKKVMELLAPEIDAHRARGLNPNHPHVRGTAQCEDIYFQAMERQNEYFLNFAGFMEEAFGWIELLLGRKYNLYEYIGSKRAKYVIVCMGSGCGSVEEYIDSTGDSEVGLLKVRLFRPWSVERFLSAMPMKSLKRVAVCCKAKDTAGIGEPLYMDVATCLQKAGFTGDVLNGRFGLSSKDFVPGMVHAVFQNLKAKAPQNPFTVGIDDDITHYSLPYAPMSTVPKGTTQCIFWGFGSDGTVGANKNTIKIIAQNTDLHAQGYFQYDALKSGGVTISYLRFGPQPIKASYLIDSDCGYLAMHKKEYIFTIKARLILGVCSEGSTLVLNVPWSDAELDTKLPGPFRKLVGEKKMKIFAIDAASVAKKTGMGKLINNIMTAVFFKLSGVLPVDQALGLLKDAVKKTYKSKGDHVVNQNIKAVDAALDELREVKYSMAEWSQATASEECYLKERDEKAPAYVEEILDKVQVREGGELKVSQLEIDGCVPGGQTAFAKRGVAENIPVVDMDKCIQCNVCSAICPHAVIRPFLVSANELATAPDGYDARKATGGNTFAGFHFRIQASPLDCTGCEVCTHACPTSALTMTPLPKALESGHGKFWNFAMQVPNRGARFDPFSLKGSQFQLPMLEFSGACEGCGETPYAKLITQMFGKRLIIANATGCSSIWGGTAGWVPYTKDKETGRGVAWGNSLFEDNAEFGCGQVLAVKQRRLQLKDRVTAALAKSGSKMSKALAGNLQQWLEFFDDRDTTDKLAQQIIPLLEAEKGNAHEIAEVLRLKDMFLKPSMWMFGGDGWANDIGYGGIDHVLAGGHEVKICVFDTEVYSNTGGQASKATPMGAVAKFAQGGRSQTKKDLGALFMKYGHIYVASCAIGANFKQTVQAFQEAEQYPGPAIMICYSPCIEHRTKTGLSQMSLDMKEAVECGYWPLYRFNPALKKEGLNPFMLDGKKLTGDVLKFLIKQNRYAQLARAAPELAEELQAKLQSHLKERHEFMRAQAAEEPATSSTKEQSTGEQIVIAYGSDTGVTEQLAKKFSGLCSERGLRVNKTCDLDELSEVDDLISAVQGAVLVVMCSTCGHGDFPQNASLFWSSISSPDVAPAALKDMRFCVFGMGDRSYTDTFCEAAKLIERRIAELGGKKILDMGIGDDRDEDKWETGLNKWLPEFWKAVKAAEPADDGAPKPPLFDIKFHDGAVLEPQQICPPNAQLLEVGESTRMTPSGYERDIRHFSLKRKGHDFPFDLGDAVAVYYENLPEDVDAALSWFGFDGDAVVTVSCVSDNVSERHTKAFQQRLTVRQILTELLDLFGRPSKSFCADLARFATSASEKKALQAMATAAGAEEWKKIVDASATFFDLCKKFQSAKPPLDQLMSILPLTKPRLYSIASSPFLEPDILDLTIVINQWKAPATGKVVTGACTRFIQRVPVGNKVACQVVCGTFQFPQDDVTPMVMVGLGTGIAPIRSFLQDKLYKKKQGVKTGPMVIFYGCRREKEELFYKEDWAMYKKEGVLTELVGAFQFDGPKPVFVGDKMDERQELITDNLLEKGGFFYMCGPAVATPSVQKALKAAVSKRGKLGDSGSEKWFQDFLHNGRYSEESY